MELTDELDLHTFRPDDVPELVPDYIDEAVRKGYSRVRIIHGKGRGTLRRMVHAALERHPAVLDFKLGDQTSGAWGATVVELDVGGGAAIDETVRAQIDGYLETVTSDARHPEYSIAPPIELPHIELLSGPVGELVLGEVVGEGGHGLIRAAEQVRLRREVAVKSARGTISDELVVRLLSEALITGSLEHPNIVPVHFIGAGEHGQPLIALKKIDGVSWSERIGESLDRDLDILLHVIDALRFAHSRRIIHCDLKPSNVMVGEFGEVYVLDWGLAVTLDSDSELLPRASERRGIAGTLAYMAPEMLTGIGLSERTDVYLLGATLHQIACGEPPHGGASISEMADSILASDITPGADVPPELAAIIRRATRPESDDRYESAAELKAAIEAFRVHRTSARLAGEAAARLDALLEARSAEQVDRGELYTLYGQCRFGFRQALREWPDNPDATSGLERAVAAMVSYELEAGESVAAERLLAELESSPDALRAEVDAVRAAERARHDPQTGRGARVVGIAALFIGFIAVLAATPLYWSELAEAPSWTGVFATGGLLTAVIAVAGVRFRSAIRASTYNRGFAIAIAIAWVATTAVMVGLWLADHSSVIMLVVHPLVWLCCIGLLAALVEPRLWPTVVVMVPVVIAMPSLADRAGLVLLGAVLIVGVANLAWISRRRSTSAA